MAIKKNSVCNIHAWEGEGRCPMCYPPMMEPGEIKYCEDLPPGPVVYREGNKHITTLPEGVQCVGMVVYNEELIVATTTGVFYLDDEGQLSPIEFAPNAFDHMETCEHGKGMTDFCDPCGRVNGGG